MPINHKFLPNNDQLQDLLSLSNQQSDLCLQRIKTDPSTQHQSKEADSTTESNVSGLKQSYDLRFGPRQESSLSTTRESLECERRESLVGTVYYLSPEMVECQSSDPGTDLWAMGIILYKMLTSKYLFDNENEYLIYDAIEKCEYTLADDLGKDARSLIEGLIRKCPSSRLGNGQEGSCLDSRSLRNHKFFREIDWDTFDSYLSPLCPQLSESQV